MTCKMVFLLIALTFAPILRSANILVFVPSPWKSHVVSFQPLFLELAHRGHNLTVVTQFAAKNPPINYTQIVIKSEMNWSKTENIFIEKNKYQFLFDDIYLRNKVSVYFIQQFVSTPDLQKFIIEDQSTFDLVIVESFFQECTVTMGHKYGVPVISFIPVAPWVLQSLYAANPSDFSYIKDFKLNGGIFLSFENRLLNTLFGLYGILFEPITYIPKLENLMNKYFQYPGYETRPSVIEMLQNISLSLIDSDAMILSPRPYVPNFVEVPGIHLQYTNKMNEKLKDFIDSANAGVVYFSFGTLIDVENIPKPILEVFLNVLGRLKQKIVFKWNNNGTEFPDNFFVDSWLPQLEILKHPNCKLFITHGGVHGLMESVFAGVPVIGFPFFGDQFQNIKISLENGFGIESNIFRLTEKTFEKDVQLILTDQKFAENAKKMSSIFQDRPLPTLDNAIYWIEYVIRHKGAHHLRSAAVDLKWYQYCLLDVIAFISLTVILSIFIFCYVTKWLIKRILSLLFKQTKVKHS